MIYQLIQRQYKIARKRRWDRAYWAIDLHSTILLPNYRDDELPVVYYPGASEAMKMLSIRADARLLMYTCSWPKEIEQYVRRFEGDGIHFDFINENTEVESQGYGCYDKKPYFNILLDDKAGFEPEKHWTEVIEALCRIPPLGKKK